MRSSVIHLGLNSEDEDVLKPKFAKCSLQKYSEFIRSDIPGPFGTKSSRPSALRPSQSSVMKPSWEELQAQVEFLTKKKRSAKRKVPAAPEKSHATRGKVSKFGASSSPSTIRERGSSGQLWVRGQMPHPVAEVSEVIGPQLHSPRAAVAKIPPGRIIEPPLDILPISFWSCSVQSAELPSGASEGEERKHLRHERDEDLFLANAELAVGALSSIIRDSNLKKADSMSVGEALASSL